MFERPHWSFSAVSQFLACPLRFFFQRVLGLPQNTVGSGLVLGSAVHNALAEYHRAIQRHQPAQIAQLHRAFLEKWQEREFGTKVSFKDGEDRNGSIEQGIALIETYFQEPPPENILAVEHELIAPVHNSQGEYLETPLVAVADLISKPAEVLKITEYKTSGRAYSNAEAEMSLQPTCYVNAIQEEYGELATVEYTILVKTKTPKVQRLKAIRTEKDLGRLGDIIQNVERAITAGAFYPVESPLNCSSCPYRKPCRQWGRSTRVVEMIGVGGVTEPE